MCVWFRWVWVRKTWEFWWRPSWKTLVKEVKSTVWMWRGRWLKVGSLTTTRQNWKIIKWCWSHTLVVFVLPGGVQEAGQEVEVTSAVAPPINGEDTENTVSVLLTFEIKEVSDSSSTQTQRLIWDQSDAETEPTMVRDRTHADILSWNQNRLISSWVAFL